MSATHEVRAFYRLDAEPPRQAGGMAFHTWHVGLHSAQTEVAAARSRPDIGRVEMREVRGNGVMGPWFEA